MLIWELKFLKDQKLHLMWKALTVQDQPLFFIKAN